MRKSDMTLRKEIFHRINGFINQYQTEIESLRVGEDIPDVVPTMNLVEEILELVALRIGEFLNEHTK